MEKKRIKEKFEKITIRRIYKNEFQKKNTLTCELEQVVTTTTSYPKQIASNSLNDNVFNSSEFGFEEQDFTRTATRVAWILVPTDTTMKDVEEKLEKLENARLYKITSNKPIIAENEKYAIESKDLNVTLDTYANRQVIRYPKGNENEGKLILDANGKIQYRRIGFSKDGKADIDLRTSEVSDFYAPKELIEEMNENVEIVEEQNIF